MARPSWMGILPRMTELVPHLNVPARPSHPLRRLIGALVPRRKSEDLAAEEQSYRQFVEALGVAVYTTDANGRITYFNEAAAQLWGRRPELGEEWCGSWRLFWPDGRPMAHGECPMAIALHENRPSAAKRRSPSGLTARGSASSHTRRPCTTPTGRLVGAVNVLVDTSDRQRAEQELCRTDGRGTARVKRGQGRLPRPRVA